MGALPQGGRGLVFVGVLIIHIVLSGLFAGVGGAFWSRDQPSKEELEETEGREAPCSQQGSSSETEAFREGAEAPRTRPALLGQGWSGEGCGSARLMEGLGGWQRGQTLPPSPQARTGLALGLSSGHTGWSCSRPVPWEGHEAQEHTQGSEKFCRNTSPFSSASPAASSAPLTWPEFLSDLGIPR